MLTQSKIRELILFQLADHIETPKGAVQPTYYSWAERHVDGAIDAAVQFVKQSLYSQGSLKTTSVKCNTTVATDCTILDLRNACEEVTDIISVNGEKATVSKNFDMMLMLRADTYAYERMGKSVFRFIKVIPQGSKVVYACSDIAETAFANHATIVINYALYLLTNADIESNVSPNIAAEYLKQANTEVEMLLNAIKQEKANGAG